MTFWLGKNGDILLMKKIRPREADPGRGSRTQGKEVCKCKAAWGNGQTSWLRGMWRM